MPELSNASAVTAGTVSTPPSLADRQRLIAAAPQVSREFVPFRGAYVDAPVIRLLNQTLVYRADNGRIVTEMHEHGAHAGTSVSNLVASQDNESTQALLHALLTAKASDPSGPILQELARHAQQTEPLLISVDGVVVNGNRRLAAMRELQRQDPARYAGFAEVTAAVLPTDATAVDFEFTEAALQMAPDVKLAYGWINRRMKLRRQRHELNLPLAAIAEAYRIEDPADIDVEIAELALAEDYLAYKRQPGNYSAAADIETLLRDLRPQLDTLSPELKPTWRLAGFAMIDGRAAITGPMDRFFPFVEALIDALPAWTLRRFAERRGVLAEIAWDAKAPDLPSAALRSLDEILRDPGAATDNAATLFDVMEQLRAEHRERRAPGAALKQMARAKSALGDLEIGRMSPKQLRQLRSELAAIQAQVAVLLGEDTSAGPKPVGGFLKRLFD